MTSNTDTAKIGEILLLVGAIISAVGAVFLLALGFGLRELIEAIDGSGGTEVAIIGWVYGGLGLLQLAGAACGFIGYNKAREGDMQGAFVFGLLNALLPPVRIIPLIGAILCKVSEDKTVPPEAD